MHNEDNKLVITITNKRGDEYTCWDDKQIFEEQNKKDKEIMKPGLQASVDEVYEALESKRAKKPPEGARYRPWKYAPNKVVAAKTYSPPSIEYTSSWCTPWKWGVKVREPFSDPWSKKYVEVGDSPALIELYNKISTSEQWKKY